MRTRKATQAAPLVGSREPCQPGAGMQLLGSLLVLAVLALTACAERGGQLARVLPDGTPLPAAPSAAQPRPQESSLQARQTGGEGSATPGALLYQANCAVCHGRQGGGGLGPALSGNQNLQPADYVIARILLGGAGMPSFAPRLTATEIASVATHVRNSWENVFGEVDPATVVAQWSGLRAGPMPGPLEQAREPGGQGTAGPEQQEQQGQDQQDQGQAGQEGVDGVQVYTEAGCHSCHGQNGEGGTGPALAGNQNLQDAQAMIRQILNGGGGMPAFSDQLSAAEVAAVATHERSSWGNDFGEITTDQVEQAQGGGEGQ